MNKANQANKSTVTCKVVALELWGPYSLKNVSNKRLKNTVVYCYSTVTSANIHVLKIGLFCDMKSNITLLKSSLITLTKAVRTT
jgi:hypothetical protein